MTATKTKRRRINRHALRAFRERASLTQETLAAHADLNHSTISHLERGSRISCTEDVAQVLARALDVPVTALYAAE